MFLLRKTACFVLLLSFLVSAIPAASLPSFFTQLTQTLQRSAAIRQNPGMNRFRWMRFYFPTAQVAPQEDWWDKLYRLFCVQDQQRAVAFYLYQMYISAAAYGTVPHGYLTVNHLGVLDGLERLKNRFDVRGAVEFYDENKAEIKKNLKQFFDNTHLASYRPDDPRNDAAERNFLRVLANSADSSGRARYRLTAPRWKSSLLPQDMAWLSQALQRVERDIGKKVVLYQTAKGDFSLLDKRVGNSARGNLAYLYRPAGQECAARAYLTGSGVCQQLAVQAPAERKISRIYRLHIKPLEGAFLRAAHGGHFYSPAGGTYPDWYYHEAILIILKHGEQYTPVVLDKFLFAKPVSLEQWMKSFNIYTTVLYATPFQRRDDTEERLVQPDGKNKKGIFKYGRLYRPYPVKK